MVFAGEPVAENVGGRYTSWKNRVVVEKNIVWAKEEKFKESVDVVLRDMMQNCYDREGKFKDGELILYEDLDPNSFSDANWNYILMANYVKFFVWGNQKYYIDRETLLDIMFDDIVTKEGGDFHKWHESLYDKEDFYEQSNNEKLIWIRGNAKGIELMGKILEKYYEYCKTKPDLYPNIGDIENLHEKIQRAIDDCKIYAEQLGLFDFMNESKISEAVKNLVNSASQQNLSPYKLNDLVRDREAVMYLLDRAKEDLDRSCQKTVNIYGKENPALPHIESGTEANPKNFIVIGDLHGDWFSLGAVLKKYLPDVAAGKLSLAFTGDYVDRGPYSLEVLLTILSLKHSYPDQILMLKGNHEERGYCDNLEYMKKSIEVADELNHYQPIHDVIARGICTCIYTNSLSDLLSDRTERSFTSDKQLKEGTLSAAIVAKTFDVYDRLPYYMILNESIYCVHAALPIPRFYKLKTTALEGYKIAKVVSTQTWIKTTKEDLMWSDINDATPSDEYTIFPSGRGAGCKIPNKVIEKILDENDARYLVKGHQHFASYNAFGDRIFNTITTLASYLAGSKASIVQITPEEGTSKCTREAVVDLLKEASTPDGADFAQIITGATSAREYIRKNLGAGAEIAALEWILSR